jgi:hypothetical protein
LCTCQPPTLILLKLYGRIQCHLLVVVVAFAILKGLAVTNKKTLDLWNLDLEDPLTSGSTQTSIWLMGQFLVTVANVTLDFNQSLRILTFLEICLCLSST